MGKAILLLIRQETTTTVTFSKRLTTKQQPTKKHPSSTVQITVVREYQQTVVHSSFVAGIELTPT